MHELAPLRARNMKNVHKSIKVVLTFYLKTIKPHTKLKQVKGKQTSPVDGLQSAWQVAAEIRQR